MTVETDSKADKEKLNRQERAKRLDEIRANISTRLGQVSKELASQYNLSIEMYST